jgi:hypothetical protein
LGGEEREGGSGRRVVACLPLAEVMSHISVVRSEVDIVGLGERSVEKLEVSENVSER